LDVMELANLELLEFRTYDAYLDDRLDEAFDALDRLWAPRGLFRSARNVARHFRTARRFCPPHRLLAPHRETVRRMVRGQAAPEPARLLPPCQLGTRCRRQDADPRGNVPTRRGRGEPPPQPH